MKKILFPLAIVMAIGVLQMGVFAGTHHKGQHAKAACVSGKCSLPVPQCPMKNGACQMPKCDMTDKSKCQMPKCDMTDKSKCQMPKCDMSKASKCPMMAGKTNQATTPVKAKSHVKRVVSAVCPVMGTKIPDVTKAAGKSVYKGKTYYFCCGGCKPAFDKNPAKYVSKK